VTVAYLAQSTHRSTKNQEGSIETNYTSINTGNKRNRANSALLFPNVRGLARLEDPTREERLSQRAMKRTTMTTMRVRRVTVVMKKTMKTVAMARMKKSRRPMLNCRLIGLLKARERCVYR
jgi:hypothetical protein